MHVLILGANSDIAYAVAKKYAESEKASIHLASRNMEQLEKKTGTGSHFRRKAIRLHWILKWIAHC